MNPSTSGTLFDIDSLAPTSGQSGDAALAKKMEQFATAETRWSSAAISRWRKATPLRPNDTVLSQLFVNGRSDDEFSLRHIVVGHDGEMTLEFISQTGQIEILDVARLADDGSLVDQTGNWLLPKALWPTPPADSGPDRQFVMGRYRLGEVVGGSLGPNAAWIVVRYIPDGKLRLYRASEVLPLPKEFKFESDPKFAPEIEAGILAPHLSELRAGVALLLSGPKNAKTVRKIYSFLASHAHLGPRHFAQAPLENHFITEEIKVLQPLMDVVQAPFAANGWVGVVTLDADRYSDDLVVRVEAEDLDVAGDAEKRSIGQQIMREIQISPSEEHEMEKWFSSDIRHNAAAALCEAPLGDTDSEIEPPQPHKKRRVKPANGNPKAADELRSVIQALTNVATDATKEAMAALQAIATSAADPCLAGETLDATRKAFEAVAHRIKERTLEGITALQAVTLWDPLLFDQARGLEKALRVLLDAGFASYSDSVRQFLSIIQAASYPREVLEVAPEWFISRGSDHSWHGAVSSTGFYSGCGFNPSASFGDHALEIMSKHLFSGPPLSVTKEINRAAKAGEIPADFAAWLIRQKQTDQPDANVRRDAGRLLMAAREKDSIARSLPAALDALNGHALDKAAVLSLIGELNCTHVSALRWHALATVASDLIRKRFGVQPDQGAILVEASLIDAEDENDCEVNEESSPSEEPEA